MTSHAITLEQVRQLAALLVNLKALTKTYHAERPAYREKKTHPLTFSCQHSTRHRRQALCAHYAQSAELLMRRGASHEKMLAWRTTSARASAGHD